MLEKFKVPSSHLAVSYSPHISQEKENKNGGANARRYEQENNTNNNNNNKVITETRSAIFKNCCLFSAIVSPIFPGPIQPKNYQRGWVTFKNEVHYTPSIPSLEPALNDKRYEGMRSTSILD